MRKAAEKVPDRFISLGAKFAELACLVALVLFPCVLFFKGLADPGEFAHEDAAYFYQPYYDYANAEILAGRLPHWNPYASCGIPYHATTQGALLHPMRWLLIPLAFKHGYPLALILNHALAGMVVYGLLRLAYRCRRPAALIGAVSFQACGFLLGHMTHMPYVWGYPWFVLAFALISLAMQRDRMTWAILAAIPIGVLAIGGSGYLLMVLGPGLCVWVGLEVLVRLADRIRGKEVSLWRIFQPLVCLAIACGLGGAIGAAQLLPTLAQTPLSTRAEADWAFVTEHCGHPARMARRMLAPFCWGNPRIGDWGDCNWMDTACYVGLLPLMAAAAGAAWLGRQRRVWKLLVLGGAMAVLAAGKFLPVFRLLYDHVPLFDRLRNPVRFWWWVELCLILVGAMGLNELLEAGRKAVPLRAKLVATAVLGVALAATVVSLVQIRQIHTDDPDGWPRTRQLLRQFDDLDAAQRTRRLGAAVRCARAVMRDHDAPTWIGIGAAIGSGVWLLGMLIWRPLRRGPGWAAAGGLVALDLAMFSSGMCCYMKDPTILPDQTPAHVRFLQENLGHDRYVSVRPVTCEVTRNRGMVYRIRNVATGGGGIEHSPRQQRMVMRAYALRPQAVALCGVKYVVLPPRACPPAATVYQSDECWIARVPRVVPRAFLARHLLTVRDGGRLLEMIFRRGADLLDTAWVEQDVEPLGPPGPAAGPPGTVQITNDDPGRYDLRVDCPAARQLVLTETYHPQWRCEVDGAAAKVVRTDYTFMSVRVPAGRHEVRWWFDPVHFRRGLVISLAAVAVLVGLLALDWAVRRGGSGRRD